MLLIVSNVFAEVTSADTVKDKWHIIPVASDLDLGTSDVVYSNYSKLTNSDHHSAMVRITSASNGTVYFTVTAVYALRPDGVYSECPEPITFATVTSLGNTTIKLNGLAFMPYIKFKLTSDGTNANDLKIDMFFLKDSKQK